MEAEPSVPATPPKRKRRWYQFSLRTLLIAVVIVAIPCAWLGRKIEQKRKEREAVEAIREENGTVVYDDNWGNEPGGTAWLRSLLGENFFNDVQLVSFGPDATDNSLRSLKCLTQLTELDVDNADVTNDGLENLKGLTQIWRLTLRGTKVSDSGLPSVKVLTKLQYLDLCETQVSDGGLAQLKNLKQLKELYLRNTEVSNVGLSNLSGLTQLKRLDLFRTKVTDAGVADLQRALPDCDILR